MSLWRRLTEKAYFFFNFTGDVFFFKRTLMEFVQMLYLKAGLYMIGYRAGKFFFEIAALLNFERGTSRARNSNENKTQTNTDAVKCNTTLNFPAF